MSKTNLLLHTVAAVAVGALASACSNDAATNTLENVPGKVETVTLVARQPNPNGSSASRVGFDDTGKGYWQAGDAIGVWSNGDGKFNTFGITSETGGATATFSGTVTDGVGKYAVYPYNEKHGMQRDAIISYYLPEKYTYTSVDQTFFPEGNNGKSFNMPMLGTISNDNTVSFVHLAGVICLQIDKMPAETGKVTVTASGKQLCGTFSAFLTDDTPEIETTNSNSDNTVTFHYDGATEGKPGVFYLPTPSGSYSLNIVVSGDGYSSTTISSVDMVRTRLQAVYIETNYTFTGGKEINGHKFIDLGLPSGLLWAETNIGAETRYDEGDYFAWGEIKTKDNYGTEGYSTPSASLSVGNDAAYQNWGNFCRMPTNVEFQELLDYCTWTWVSRTNSDGNSINCYKVVGKNDNVIYFPASGRIESSGSMNRSELGNYWSRTFFDDSGNDYTSGYMLEFSSWYKKVTGDYYPNVGGSVRPVAEQ